MSSYLHLFSFLSLGAYSVYLVSIILKLFRSFKDIILYLGIVSHTITLILLINESSLKETASAFESSPALLLMMCSLLMFIIYSISSEKSYVYSSLICLFSLVLYILSAYLLHVQGVSSAYEVSPLLLVHIFLSILSQVSVFFIIISSILIIVVHWSLKKKRYKDLQSMPALVPLKNTLVSLLFFSVLFFISSFLTGIFLEGAFEQNKLKLVFSFLYILCYAFLYTLLKKGYHSLPLISVLIALISIVLLVLQFGYRFIPKAV